MNKYIVSITKKTTAVQDLLIEAHDEIEAEELARQEAEQIQLSVSEAETTVDYIRNMDE